MYPEKMEALIKKDTRTPAFIAALFRITKIWKQTKCPSAGEWTKNSTIRKNEMLSFATTSMDQEGFMPSEISQIEKIKYCLSLMWNRKNVANKPVITGGGEALRGTNYYIRYIYVCTCICVYNLQRQGISQYFIITINGILSIQILNHSVVYLRLT